MILCRVIGTVVSTQKDAKLQGVKLLVTQPVSLDGRKDEGRPLVAVDSVGAGLGEVVLVVAGSSARQTGLTQNTPVDAAIMAIVDYVELGGETVFAKDQEVGP